MVTINKIFDIPKAKGRGEFKILHCTFDDWGFTDGKYNAGGVEVEIPDVREVVVPLMATLEGTSGAGALLQPVSWSGKAIKLMAWVTGLSGAVFHELATDAETSGTGLKVDVAAVCEAE